MDLSAIYEIVGMVGTIFTVGGAMWSRRAAKLSLPTGNGFVARLEARLDRIEARLDNLDPR